METTFTETFLVECGCVVAKFSRGNGVTVGVSITKLCDLHDPATLTSDQMVKALTTDKAFCPDCGHPWLKHDSEYGCLMHVTKPYGRDGRLPAPCKCQTEG